MAGLGRRRIVTRNPTVHAAAVAAPGTANLSWGPDFGTVGGEKGVGVSQLPLDTVGVGITQTCGCHPFVDAWDVNYNPITGGNLGATLADPVNVNDLTLDYPNQLRTCGCTLNGLNNDLTLEYNQPNCGTTASLDTVAPEFNQTVGVHLSGTSVGAPSWAAATTAIGPADATNTVISVPAGTVDGDLLLLHGSLENTGTVDNFTTPSGWTLIASVNFAGSLVTIRSNTWFRVASSEPASYSVALVAPGTSNQGKLLEMHRIQGVDGVTPVNANTTATLSSTALSTSPAAPSVTTTVANCLVFAFLSHDHESLSNTHTPATGEVERTDFQNTTLIIGSQSCDTKVFAAIGATGTTVFTCSETVSTDAVMQRIAVAPGAIVLAA